MTDQFDPKLDATTLVGIYYQVSRRHRYVARFPSGILDGRAALRDGLLHYRRTYNKQPEPVTLTDHEEKWIRRMSDGAAGDHFLRVYSTYRGNELSYELTHRQFDAFRKAGGDTYAASKGRK